MDKISQDGKLIPSENNQDEALAIFLSQNDMGKPSDPNRDSIRGITPEEMDHPGTSTTLKYLQHLSILFSILFSIA
jgi:hypothetical protein